MSESLDDLSPVDRAFVERVRAHMDKVDAATNLGLERRKLMQSVQMTEHRGVWRLTWWDQDGVAHEHDGISSFQGALRELERYFFPDWSAIAEGGE